MRILLIATAYNSLTQRVEAELGDRGHLVRFREAGDESALSRAVEQDDPHLVIAPMLKTAIPAEVYKRRVCLIVHPGPMGDRGPSALDWAVDGGERRWGVTVLQAAEEMDGGDIWATVGCELPPRAKSDLYRGEIADAALQAVHLAVERYASGRYVPEPLDYTRPDVRGRARPYFRQDRRRIDWAADDTRTVLRKLRAADSFPGVLDEIGGREYFLYGGHAEDELRGRPGRLLARRAGAVCRATADGAVWLTQLRPRRTAEGPATFKMPATKALGATAQLLPHVPAPLTLPAGRRTWTDIHYREHAGGRVGVLGFSFPAGAMSTDQCRRLLAAYRHALTRRTKVLVLGGERDFFSNGIHLGTIEAADDPAGESWANINAMNDVVKAVLETTDRLTVAALGGNAAAGGVMFALAADEVWCRQGVILNPHYRRMGLYGSEYWTYTLPRRVGWEQAHLLTDDAVPVSASRARHLGLVDHVLPAGPEEFRSAAAELAQTVAASRHLAARLREKRRRRERDESIKPLEWYRSGELARMWRNFYAADSPYHALRTAFIRKQPAELARSRA
ncbi:hydrogenase maturation protein [Streptomyces sp. A7024]|uniref:Hydrogenase maturation protein n=1 Tax=Streptomyces coryli TaxID=1128680 RepID=A0A6G4TXN2_9ACTN|nr:hydrogenase maturation protein [Streptomyces coryli]NGN64206.1 hydrogenase maturation protein [Streptomyces coryli]